MFRIIIPPLSLWSDSISNNAIGLFLCKWYVLYCFLLLLKSFRDYLSGSVAKNPPSNALDIVQSLVKEVRAHTLQGNEANRALLQHLCAVTGEACTVQLLSPCALELLCHKRSPCATTKSPSAAAKTQSSKKKKNLLIFGVLEYNVSIGVCGFLFFKFIPISVEWCFSTVWGNPYCLWIAPIFHSLHSALLEIIMCTLDL